VIRKMIEYSIIGKHVPRVEAKPMVTGRLKYVNDITLPGMLYGKILRSPYAHAKILSIDTSKAERLPGVKAVITAKDTPMVKFALHAQYGIEDEVSLAIDKVLYVGDRVAAVAAIDEDTAEEALDLIKVEYEELPAVFDPEEAMKPDAPRIHDDVEGNIRHRILHTFGDVEKGFEESDYVREDRFKTPMVISCSLGTRCCVADFVRDTGELTIYSDSQVPYQGKPYLAYIIGMPVEKIRSIRPYLPGCFGSRISSDDVNIISALLSMKTGKPVKIEHSRDEFLRVIPSRHALIAEFKTGVKKDGTLVATQCRHITDNGAYTVFGIMNTLQNSDLLDLILRVPNVKFEGLVVYTNTRPGLGMRALMNNSFCSGFYSHLDMLARDVGMDVADFYLKNAHQKGDVTTSRCKLDSCGISECIQEVIKASDWKNKRGKLPKNRGLGLGLGAHTAGFQWGGETSTVVVIADYLGKVGILSGRGEYGQGSSTMICMCVAEELGLKLEDVSINEVVDDSIVPYESSNYGSRGTVGQGRAAIAAAQDLRRQLFEVVAEKFGAEVEDMEAKEGRIFVKQSPDKGMPFQEAVKAYQDAGKLLPLIGRGRYDPPSEEMDFYTGEGNVSVAWGFGAQVIEVEVDTDTGEVKVLNVVTANDCGKALNPLQLEGSSEGGILMGLGSALFEGVFHNERGEVIGTTFPTYGMPTSKEIPTNIKHIWVETMDPYGPYGAKGITEVVELPTANAIANAIYDAVGVRIREFPITPEKILDALKKARIRDKREYYETI